ncbi:Ran-binding-domain-containing protein [Hypomontagnella monticulosa]|nr:Ran-binding-domain-containing protein [Hypomontagnella monticulosa]
MDAFLAKLSYHATSYAIRSCLALTSTFVIQQGSRLLKTVEDDPMRTELSQLQRRLARKIELISPILESIEFRYTRGNSTLEAVARAAQELRADVDSLGKRLQVAALGDESQENGGAKNPTTTSVRRIQIQSIIKDIKQLILDIDDAIPLVNLWVSAIGGIQAQPTSFSPSRLLQASMLVNVGDTQYILNPSQPMQIGPDFFLSLYMPFRAHTSEGLGEPYGIEDGQRKPIWQEVIHKARVRLRRVPANDHSAGMNTPFACYAYELQIVEDLDDGRVHTLEDGEEQPSSYDGIPAAGIRELVPVHQISKMFYADVGRILNINNEDGASSNPVLLLKRDVKAPPRNEESPTDIGDTGAPKLIQDTDKSVISDDTLEDDSEGEINRQLQQEIAAAEIILSSENTPPTPPNPWRLPQDLDPEWIALEVFEIDNDSSTDTTGEDDEPTPEEGEEGQAEEAGDDKDGDHTHFIHLHRPKHAPRTSVDSNLITQLNRMSLASTSRPSSRDSGALIPDPGTAAFDENLLSRSPFGAIQTSLSLLEMMLRLASLQEFEQTTHLAIPDHVLRFYLDESVSRTDPDAPVHHGAGLGRN